MRFEKQNPVSKIRFNLPKNRDEKNYFILKIKMGNPENQDEIAESGPNFILKSKTFLSTRNKELIANANAGHSNRPSRKRSSCTELAL